MPRSAAAVILILLLALSIFTYVYISDKDGSAPSKTPPDAETQAETLAAAKEDTDTSSPETTPSQTTEAQTTAAPTTEPETSAPQSPASPYPHNVYTTQQLEAFDNTKNGYGQGLAVDASNRPYGATNAQNAYGAYGAVFIAPDNGNIYLTFDLGYENGYTGTILDVLAAKGVHATFFATMEYCLSQPELVSRIINEGHTLGNHSVSHKSMPSLSVAEMESEIMGLHEYILSNYGYKMTLFRPPMGEYSVRSLAVAQNLGYKSVNWSFAYYDYDTANQPEPSAALERVTGAAHGGGVFLLHAVSETNTKILPDVIDKLTAAGYRLEAMS